MQIIGLALTIAVIAFGFMNKPQSQISFFDPHALGIIIMGVVGAVLLGSKPRDFVKTFVVLREFLPFVGRYDRLTNKMEEERRKLEKLWIQGKRADAIALAENSSLATTREMLQQIAARASVALSENRFTAFVHEVVDEHETSIANWEMMAKLGPSFGMVGTITGMIQLFKSFASGSSDLGAAMSLALLATLYGIAFGAGIAGPIANFIQRLMNDRISVIERCEKTTRQLVSMGE
ncbi:MAG TPA: MotA/TolQ/ExbB proton channel family protein [Oligoflexus sp.]|uniref:MotA/TolQ/ExbB proton channel family protein n=1 Tax=Oligoflexus sp. TaxID=1971216 RepID=UPI002D66FA17|nr:MotA/TolQ/ExbB proton channel family protein [Oligoflexus sp.]HYX32886.1 MotA/TolQ/ExbB proton channel family protein [Oligoflexus sp.]